LGTGGSCDWVTDGKVGVLGAIDAYGGRHANREPREQLTGATGEAVR